MEETTRKAVNREAQGWADAAKEATTLSEATGASREEQEASWAFNEKVQKLFLALADATSTPEKASDLASTLFWLEQTTDHLGTDEGSSTDVLLALCDLLG